MYEYREKLPDAQKWDRWKPCSTWPSLAVALSGAGVKASVTYSDGSKVQVRRATA